MSIIGKTGAALALLALAAAASTGPCAPTGLGWLLPSGTAVP